MVWLVFTCAQKWWNIVSNFIFRQYFHTSELIPNPTYSKLGLVGPTYLHSDVTSESWIRTKTLRYNILRSAIFKDICFCIHASAQHFWIRTTLAIQFAARWYRKFLFRFFLWQRHIIHNTLIVLDRHLRFVRNKTIPICTEPCLESFYLPFVAVVDLSYQGVMDCSRPRANGRHDC